MARQLLEPKKVLEKVPIIGGSFWISAKLDKTAKWHFAGTFLCCFISAELALGMALAFELGDGRTTTPCMVQHKCKQGFDLIDFGAAVLAVVVFQKLLVA